MPPIFSQHSTEFSKTVLSCIGDGVLSVDHLGNVTYLNPVAERLTGWTSADAEGQPVEAIFNIVNESTRKTVLNPVREAIANQRPVELANHTILIDRHGNETPIDDSAAPILTQLGSGTVEAALDQATETQSDSWQSVVGAVLIFRSIADRRETERHVPVAFGVYRRRVKRLRWILGFVQIPRRDYFDVLTGSGTVVNAGSGVPVLSSRAVLQAAEATSQRNRNGRTKIYSFHHVSP